jgi:C4-dicarboxylate transporter DctM subunit
VKENYAPRSMAGWNFNSIGAYTPPLFFLMVVAVVLVAMFPGIALWLPSTMPDAH